MSSLKLMLTLKLSKINSSEVPYCEILCAQMHFDDL